MGEYLRKIVTQIQTFFQKLNPAKRAAMIAVSILIVFGIFSLFFWAGNTTYVPLMTNLNPEDSTNIIRVLRDKHIPFKVDPGGKNITIPSENLYELRLELATMGLPQTSVIGYEIFDKQALGTTSFIQKLNQKRALEGELMRTINSMKGVHRSRVHLAIPQKSAFVEDQKKPTASVVLDLDPGVVLNEKQVYGIGNMVARAVEGLEVSDVVIMNSDGKVISRNSSDPLAAATANQLDFQEKLQADLEKRVEEVLTRVVGEGHVVAKVTADLDFSQVNETQTLYDGDSSAVVSVEKRNDNMLGTRPGPGVSGVVSNTPGQPPTVNNNEVKTETSRSNEVTNYKVPETIRRTTHSQGAIRRLSVAVVIDGKRVKTKAPDGKAVVNVESWPSDKMKEFEQIVSSAVGLDRKRGDTIEIKNIEFTLEDFEEATRVISEKERTNYIQNMVIYTVIGITILLFFMFVVRPFIKWVTENTIDNVDSFLPQTIEELEKIQKNTTLPVLEEAVPVMPESIDPAKVEGELIKEKIVTLVDANPHKAALILGDWLHGDGKKRERSLASDDKKSNKEKAASG